MTTPSGLHPRSFPTCSLLSWTRPSVLLVVVKGMYHLQLDHVSQAMDQLTSRSVHLDEDRKDEKVITPWEVAAIRSFDASGKHLAIRAVADGGQWCLVGRTIIVRTELLKNEAFYKAFVREMWFFKALNTGDDVFITRWIQSRMGAKIAIQDCPEAEVTTTIKRDSAFASQMLRWQRSALVMLLTNLVLDPGLSELAEKHPYMARKMYERLLRPVLNWLYVLSWMVTLGYFPVIG